jgi:hypothetical protein
MPLVTHLSSIHDRSLASLADPISMRTPINERKHPIQSAHTTFIESKATLTSSTKEQTSFNTHQHKHQLPSSIYKYPKRLSAIEVLANKYMASMIPRASTGLFWYNANRTGVS